MYDQATAVFFELWNQFINVLRGRLMAEREKRPLSYSICSLVLNDEKLNWTNPSHPLGGWLAAYSKNNPVKGNLILSIIMENVQFSQYEAKKQSGLTAAEIIGYCVVPILLAVLCGIISVLLHANNLIQFAAALSPAVIAVLVFSAINSKRKTPVSKIDEYLAQIDKFRNVIADILTREN